MSQQSKDSYIDWESMYYEIASVIPNDPRFVYDRFFNLTPINTILTAVEKIRKLENRKLHNASIPLSILTVATLSPHVKDASKLSEENYQPFRHLVEEGDLETTIPYSEYAKTQLQFAMRYNMAPNWLGSTIAEVIKGFKPEKKHLPLCFSAPDFFAVGPRLKKGRLGFEALFIGSRVCKEELLIYCQMKKPRRKPSSFDYGTIRVPKDYLIPGRIILGAEVDFIKVESPRYWHL